MEGLMHLCRNWGDSDCHSDVYVYKHPKELREEDDTAIWPAGEELIRIDDICKKCEARFFEIEEMECPACGGTDLKKVKGFIILDKKDKRRLENYYLKCNLCNTPSVLKKILEY